MLRANAGAVLPVRSETRTPLRYCRTVEINGDSLWGFFCLFFSRFRALVKRRRDGVLDDAASLVVPPIVGNAMPTHHCVPQDVDPELVFFCRHVYDFRYGRLLKNLQ